MKIKFCKWQLELVPLIVTIIATIALICLGNWQLGRLTEKEQFIINIESNIANPAINLSTPNTPLYSKVKLSGHFLRGKNAYLYGRRTSAPEKDGYYLISAFAADNGKTYLVSRGWLSHSAKDHINFTYEQQIIEGMTLPGEKKNPFVPANDLIGRVWFTLDLDIAKNALSINETNFYIMQTKSENQPASLANLNTKNLSKVRNDHLEYAITWYSLAFCLVVIFIVYSRSQQKS